VTGARALGLFFLGAALGAALVGATSAAHAESLHADTEGSRPKAYFYHGLDYGSESLYNPLTVLLNRGFDNQQLQPNDSSIVTNREWRTNSGNVLDNVAHPFRAIGGEGWGKFLREEIFPLTWGVQGARWAPNYGLHLVGGGQTYAMLREWYVAHDVPLPALFSVATLYAAALVNESLENKGVVGPNTDCLADLYVFDLAGVLLFSAEPAREFFSKYLIVSDSSLQPTFHLSSGDLRNVGNNYSIKFPLPFYERLRLFGYIGMQTMGGLSFVLERGYSVSVAVGARVTRLQATANNAVYNVIGSAPAAAILVDRNESTLFSLQISGVDYDYARLQLYPNAFFRTDPGIGLFAGVTQYGHVMAGISVTRALGLGVAAGKP
jgi:hypothetical protein